MKVYKDVDFHHWQKKGGLKNQQLLDAIKEVEAGLYEAKLGDMYKKRIAKLGMGKRGGFRTIIPCKKSLAWFYIYGFSKNETENIDEKTKKALKCYIHDFLFPNIDRLIQASELIEVKINE